MPPIIYPSRHENGRRGAIFAYLEARAVLSDEKHFRESHLTHLVVSPTSKALARLSWTAYEPLLATNIQSITVTYNNTSVTRSDGLCPGMWIRGEVDHLLRALRHLHRMGKQVELIVKIAKTPVDGKSTIISITCPVLMYVLSGHGAQGVKKLFLDFDDTASTQLPIYTTSQQMLTLEEDLGPRYQRIWACMMAVKTLTKVRFRFSKTTEKMDPRWERCLTIVRFDSGIHVGMQFLQTWHFDMMGRLNIFSKVFSLNNQNCALITRHRDDLFKNRNLLGLVLGNVDLHAVHRSINPPSAFHTLKYWYHTMTFIAANTALEEFQAYSLRNSDDQVLHPQPWILTSTAERSVNQTLRLNYPS